MRLIGFLILFFTLCNCNASLGTEPSSPTKSLVSSYRHIENTDLKVADDKPVTLFRIELAASIGLTVAGIAATIFLPLPFQIALACISISIAAYSNREDLALQFKKLKKWTAIRYEEFMAKKPKLGRRKIKGEVVNVIEHREVPLILYTRKVQEFEGEEKPFVIMQGIPFKVEQNTSFQCLARELTKFLRKNIKDHKNLSLKKVEIQFQGFDELAKKSTGKVYSKEVRTLVAAVKMEVNSIITKMEKKAGKKFAVSRSNKSAADDKKFHKKYAHLKQNKSAAANENKSTFVFKRKQRAETIKLGFREKRSTADQEKESNDYSYHLLAIILIEKTRNYFENVAEVCTQYILLIRHMPAYKNAGPAPSHCTEDFEDYEWLIQMEVVIIHQLPEALRNPILILKKNRHRDSVTKLLQDRSKMYSNKYNLEFDTDYNLFDENKYGEKAKQILHQVSSLDPFLRDPFSFIPEEGKRNEAIVEKLVENAVSKAPEMKQSILKSFWNNVVLRVATK